MRQPADGGPARPATRVLAVDSAGVRLMNSANPSFTLFDESMMHSALALAQTGLYSTRPNPAVGCVIVQGERIVGRGAHLRAGEPHAEIHALAEAGKSAQGATVYVTLEPCSHTGRTPPCCEALIRAGVARVVAACRDPNPQVQGEGLRQLQQAGIQAESGLLATEARELNAGFMSRMERGLPYVRAKVAMSLDGGTALADGQSQWITGASARTDGHLLRARAGAILTGCGTVLHDDPLLTVRHPVFEQTGLPQPLRVVVDSHLRTPPHARLFSVPGPVLLAHSQTDARMHPGELTSLATGSSFNGKRSVASASGQFSNEVMSATTATILPGYSGDTTTLALPGNDGRVDLARLLHHLAAEHAINDVHVEAGAQLIGALLQLNLIDELVCYMAPDLLGDEARGVATLPGITRLSQKIRTRIRSITPVGEDWRIEAKIIHTGPENELS